MSISASDVVKLRSMTGAGMMDCKNALEEAGGDMEKAADLLRKKGIVKAAKRADKVAAEGKVASFINGDDTIGSLAEVNCETDFVAKSDDFIQFSKRVTEEVANQNPADLEAVSALKLDDKTVAETVHELTLKIGEKIGVRRFVRYQAEAGNYVTMYLHGTKIGVLVEMTGSDHMVGMEVALHIAASNPRYLSRDMVDATEIAREKDVYAEQLKAQGKPENIIENILKGKMDKFYSEVCLLEQPFIKDEDMTVEKFVASKASKIVRFVRFELGEGIEKVVKDFASEVAEQIK